MVDTEEGAGQGVEEEVSVQPENTQPQTQVTSSNNVTNRKPYGQADPEKSAQISPPKAAAPVTQTPPPAQNNWGNPNVKQPETPKVYGGLNFEAQKPKSNFRDYKTAPTGPTHHGIKIPASYNVPAKQIQTPPAVQNPVRPNWGGAPNQNGPRFGQQNQNQSNYQAQNNNGYGNQNNF